MLKLKQRKQTMSNWQKRFAQKVEQVKEASRDNFEDAAESLLGPAFEMFREFTSKQGFCATVPVSKPGIRAFKFAMTENAYLFMTFRLVGFDHCELQCDIFVPGREKISTKPVKSDLSRSNKEWAEKQFEDSLDGFLDKFVEAMGSGAGARPELVTA